MAKSSIPFGRIKLHLKVWLSAQMEETVSAGRKALTAAHRSDEDCQAYCTPPLPEVLCLSLLRHGRQHALLSPKSYTKFV